jgi:hypothetical protein
VARIKLGGVISDIRGSLGGSTFAVSPGGAVVRRRSFTRRGTSARLGVTQSRLVTLAQRWSSQLSAVQRLGWRLRVDQRGNPLSFFIGGNLARLNAGLEIQDDPPADLTAIALLSLSVVAAAPDEALLYFSPSSLPAGFRLYLYAAPPTSFPRVMRSTDMAFLGVSLAGASSPFDAGPLLKAKYSDLVDGNFLQLFVRVLKDDGGVLGPGLLVTGAQAQVAPFVPPVQGDFMLPTVTTLGGASIGVDLAAQVVAAPASTAWGTANLARLVPFVVTRNFTVQTLFWANGATLAGNVDAGIYDSSFVRVVSTGAVAQAGASTLQLVSVAPTLLVPGRYYLALSLNTTTATILRSSLSTAQRARFAGMLEVGGAFPLPASVVPGPAASTGINLHGASELAAIF